MNGLYPNLSTIWPLNFDLTECYCRYQQFRHLTFDLTEWYCRYQQFRHLTFDLTEWSCRYQQFRHLTFDLSDTVGINGHAWYRKWLVNLSRVRVRVMVFNTTFNNISGISWWSVLLVEEPGVPGENQWPVTSHWQTSSHNVVSSTSRLRGIRQTQFQWW